MGVNKVKYNKIIVKKNVKRCSAISGSKKNINKVKCIQSAVRLLVVHKILNKVDGTIKSE